MLFSHMKFFLEWKQILYKTEFMVLQKSFSVIKMSRHVLRTEAQM